MEKQIYTSYLNSDNEAIIYYAVKNPNTPAHLRTIACNLSVHFDEECLSAWKDDHAEEWRQLEQFAGEEGYCDPEMMKFD